MHACNEGQAASYSEDRPTTYCSLGLLEMLFRETPPASRSNSCGELRVFFWRSMGCSRVGIWERVFGLWVVPKVRIKLPRVAGGLDQPSCRFFAVCRSFPVPIASTYSVHRRLDKTLLLYPQTVTIVLFRTRTDGPFLLPLPNLVVTDLDCPQ